MSLDTKETRQLFTGFRAVHDSWLPHSHHGFAVPVVLRVAGLQEVSMVVGEVWSRSARLEKLLCSGTILTDSFRLLATEFQITTVPREVIV
jgi:hypothetical protein